MTRTLSRRRILALTPLAFAGRGAQAGTGPLGDMMWEYFRRETEASDIARRAKLAAIRSKEQLRPVQDMVVRVLREGIGAFPARTPLNVRTVGEIVHDDYVIEKIIFESQPEYYVPVNLYRPKSTAQRRAAVVHPCGHYEEAKAKDDYQRVCIGLATKGIVTLTFDPMGQGERPMYRRPGEKRPNLGEHQFPGRQALLVGRSMANYFIWDAMRAIDYLETRPDVAKDRIGMIGHSGGGTMTLYTAPLEPRIRASMSCCAVTSFYHKYIHKEPGDAEQVLPLIVPNHVDHTELIAASAPRAFLIGAATKDHVPLDGVRRTYEETKAIYEMLGHADRFGKVETENVHMLDKNLREACYAWMLKHLANETGGASEPEMQVESTERLWCTKTGTVMDLERAKSTFDLNRSQARALADKRRPATREDVKTLLASPKAEPAIDVPVTLTKGAAHAGTLIVICAEKGRNSAYAQELSRTLVDAGYSVLAADVRGWGETTATTEKRDKRSTWDEVFTWRALECGRPLLGMRVADLLGAVRKVSAEYRKIYLLGVEGGGLVALHAAAVEPSIAGVATNRTLQSYQAVMESMTYAEPVSSFVFGALTRYDLPDLAKLVAPRPYVAVDAMDARRRSVSGAGETAAPAAAREIISGLHLS